MGLKLCADGSYMTGERRGDMGWILCAQGVQMQANAFSMLGAHWGAAKCCFAKSLGVLWVHASALVWARVSAPSSWEGVPLHPDAAHARWGPEHATKAGRQSFLRTHCSLKVSKPERKLQKLN